MLEPKICGDFIRRQRIIKGLTQQQLADKLLITNKAVSKWENGECFPDITVIPELAKIFDCTTDEILNGDQQKITIAEKVAINETVTSPIGEKIIIENIQKDVTPKGIIIQPKSRTILTVSIVFIIICAIIIPILTNSFKEKTYKIGDTIKAASVDFMVISINYPETISNVRPGSGMSFIMIEIEFINVSDINFIIYEDDFNYTNKLTTQTNTQTIFFRDSKMLFKTMEELLQGIRLEPNSKRKGYLVFQASLDGLSNQKLIFTKSVNESITKSYTIEFPSRV